MMWFDCSDIAISEVLVETIVLKVFQMLILFHTISDLALFYVKVSHYVDWL